MEGNHTAVIRLRVSPQNRPAGIVRERSYLCGKSICDHFPNCAKRLCSCVIAALDAFSEQEGVAGKLSADRIHLDFAQASA